MFHVKHSANALTTKILYIMPYICQVEFYKLNAEAAYEAV